MENLLEKLLIDTDVNIEEIKKITFNEFELDKNATLKLLETYTDIEDILEDLIFWGKNFKIEILDEYNEYGDCSRKFLINYFVVPKTIEKIIPDNLKFTYDYTAKNKKTYKVPFKSKEIIKKEKAEEKRRKEEEKKYNEKIIKEALDFLDEKERILLNKDVKELENFTILNDKTNYWFNRYIVIPNDLNLYTNSNFAEFLGNDLSQIIDFYGYLFPKDEVEICGLFRCKEKFWHKQQVVKRRNQMIDNLLKNKKIYNCIGFSSNYIPESLEDYTPDELANMITEKIQEFYTKNKIDN